MTRHQVEQILRTLDTVEATLRWCETRLTRMRELVLRENPQSDMTLRGERKTSGAARQG